MDLYAKEKDKKKKKNSLPPKKLNPIVNEDTKKKQSKLNPLNKVKN